MRQRFRSWRSRTWPISTSSGAASIRWPRAASSARCSRSFRRASRAATRSVSTSALLLRALRDYPVAVELRHRSWSDALDDTLTLLNAFQRRLGADRRAEVPLLDPAELPAEHPRLLLHAAARPERRAVVAARQVPRIATTTSTQPSELQEFSDTADAARQLVKKAYLYTNNHFSAKSVANAVMIKAAARRADRRRLPAGVRGRVSRDGDARSNPDTLAPARVTAPRNYSRR